MRGSSLATLWDEPVSLSVIENMALSAALLPEKVQMGLLLPCLSLALRTSLLQLVLHTGLGKT